MSDASLLSRWTSGVSRLRTDPTVIDVAVSVVLLLVMVAGLLTKAATPAQHPNNAGAYLLAVGMAAPYAVHRRAPYLATAVGLGCLLLYSAIGYAAFPGINAFVLLFGIALHHERTRSVSAFLATAAALVCAVLLQPAGVVDRSSAVSTGLGAIIAALSGDNLRQRRARWAGLREQNRLLEREREERARQAVVEERVRIARELHDVVAHAMSVIAVQSGVGSHVAADNPLEAQRALAAIETTSRSALIEMRRLLGVLRQESDDPAQTVPARGLRDVPALIRQVDDGGLTATLQIKGAPRDVPPGLDLSAYRIIQEALTNAIKHGGPHAEVTVSYTDRDISVEVTNDGSLNSERGQSSVTPGHGIIGMRERVAIFAGEFAAAPRPGGGFRVAARLPLDGSDS
jgi:signal transduction histidine kinase